MTQCVHPAKDPTNCKVCRRLVAQGFVQGEITYQPCPRTKRGSIVTEYEKSNP